MGRPSRRDDELAQTLKNIAKKLHLEKTSPIDATAWFLGPKAENEEALHKLVSMAVSKLPGKRIRAHA